MGTSVTRTRSATWLVAPPDAEADVGVVVADRLCAIGAGRAPALVREVVNRTVEAARRAHATGGDLEAALVAAVLDAVDAAARSGRTDPATQQMPPGLRRHLQLVGTSTTAADAADWVARIVGAVEGIAEQGSDDPDRVALLTAATILMDVGGGLAHRFCCRVHGDALVAAIEAIANGDVSGDALAGLAALVEANASFERGVDHYEEGDPQAAVAQLQRARVRFLDAGLRVEASVSLVEQARIESETAGGTDTALGHYEDARRVLVEAGRRVEVARADRDLALALAGSNRLGHEAAIGLVDAAAAVLAEHALVRDLVLCDVVRACIAREGGGPEAAEHHLRNAADRLDALGLTERASRVRFLADRRR